MCSSDLQSDLGHRRGRSQVCISPHTDSGRALMKLCRIVVLMACTVGLHADEGLWPYAQFPKQAIQEKYQAEISDGFLDNLRQASVLIGDGAGSFVSANGLILTNQHLAEKCIARIGPNAIRDGFTANSRDREFKCTELTAQVLLSVEDVTTKVKGAAKDNAPAAQALQARNAAAAQLEKACPASEKCSVVKLFSGGRYERNHYKVY